MAAEIFDVYSEDALKTICNEVQDKYHMQAAVYNAEHKPVLPPAKLENEICAHIKSSTEGNTYICGQSHRTIATMAVNTGRSIIEECDAGFLKFVVPLFHDGRHIGEISACGRRPEAGEIDIAYIKETVKELESPIEEFIGTVMPVDIDTVEEAVTLVETRIQALMSSDAG